MGMVSRRRPCVGGGDLLAVAVLLLSCLSRGASAADPAASFGDNFEITGAEDHVKTSADGQTWYLYLDNKTGVGFQTKQRYLFGWFSMKLKLVGNDSAGVVTAYYMCSDVDAAPQRDELDFEFLGNRRRHEWRLQTNVYGNGSTDRGREERYLMPFDPTAEAHRFSILWSSRVVIFYMDGVAVREVPRSGAMGGDYPSKPMALYATIWDGSTWATDNGRYKVNYKRGPFTAEFSDLVLRGCPAAAVMRHEDTAALQLQLGAAAENRDRCAGAEFELMTADYAIVTPRKRMEMRRWRQRQMLYTVCYDTNRYPAPFPECDVNMAERQKFWEWGESKVVRPRVRGRSGRRRPATQLVSLQQAD